MTPEEIKTLKIEMAVLKFDIEEIIEEKIREILLDSNKRKTYIERGYRA